MDEGLQEAGLGLQSGPLVGAMHLRLHPQEVETTAQKCTQVRCITITSMTASGS